MATFKKIEYYDLREEVLAGNLSEMIGRMKELERVTRIIGRRTNNNILIVGPSGIGKTTFVHGLCKALAKRSEYDQYHLIQFDTDHLHSFEDSEQEERSQEALTKLPPCILFVDNFGRAVHANKSLMQRVFRLYKQILKESDVRVVFTLEPHEYEWLSREYPAFAQSFEMIMLKKQSAAEYVRVLRNALPYLNEVHQVMVPTTSLEEVIAYIERFPKLGQLPQAAIGVLDESISLSVAKRRTIVRGDVVTEVVADKVGIPQTQLKAGDFENLRNLEHTLNARIIDQKESIRKIAITLQRARLGVRNPDKPLGSFLLLGPSGVGKTETAKLIAEIVFGRSESFTRFDMSEFQQDHTIQRLIGAPAGYVGYEEGGALTNALRNEPHSLILLDEIEKAHPKVFDIFLQVLDDGRLTSGQNETVDARNAIIMATSNIGVDQIIKEFENGTSVSSDTFIQEKIVPALAKTFRLEFINRFDTILVFNPLTVSGLVQIAHLEVKKIEKRLAKHGVQFDLDPVMIESKIKPLADPRFGARPVKRFIEETCESLVVGSLLHT